MATKKKPKNKVYFYNIEMTPLIEDGVRRVIDHFFNLKNPIAITFVGGTEYAYHSFYAMKTHDIVVLLGPHTKDTEEKPCDTQLHLLETIIHELRHAYQAENWKDYESDINHNNEAMELPKFKYLYSKVETDARAYAQLHLLEAFGVYNG